VAVHSTPGAVTQTVGGADLATTAIPAGTTLPPQPGGDARPPSPTPSGDTPRITALRITTTRLTRPHGAKRSQQRISYQDSAAAATTFILERAMPGVRHGSQCTAPPRRGRAHGHACTRYVPVRGSFGHRDVAGSNSLAFPSVLKPGRYLLVATPTAPSGAAGPPSQARFVIR
jgi:hypothetical protein